MADVEVAESPATAPVSGGADNAGGSEGLPQAFEPAPHASTGAWNPAETQKELERQYDVTDPSELPTPKDEEAEKTEADSAQKQGDGEEIDGGLFERATKLGFSEQEISNLGTNANLQMIVDRMEKASGNTAEAQPPAAKEPEKKTETKTDPEFKFDLDEKEFDPKVVGELNRLNAHYAKKFSDLQGSFEAKLNDALGFVNQQRAAQNEVALDAAFQTLGNEFKPFVGEKSIAEVGINSDQGKTRVAIIDQARVLASGLAQVGKPVPPINTLLSQAAQLVLGSKLKTIATDSVRSAVASRQSQFISRPTSVNAVDKGTPEARATAAVKRFFKERGIED